MESWSYYISNGNNKGLVSTSVVESQSRTGFVNWVSDQQQQDTGPSLVVPQLIYQQQQQIIPPPNPMMDLSSGDSSSLIDLKKLGRRLVERDAIMCCSVVPVPAKRGRRVGGKTAYYCQVYGCNKDLSSSKDYHKRHKVCDLHSKTSTVIVNGIQQRFCQQCSRFHLLAEFDDSKRSCRKRLAGHNERRRKTTQGGAHSGRSAKLPQRPVVNNGNKPKESIFAPTSFIYQGIMPTTCLPNLDIKAENYSTAFLATPIPNAQLRLPYTLDKNLPFFQASSSSMGLADASFSGFTTGISGPGCALSLLSSPSQSSSTHSSAFIPHSPIPNWNGQTIESPIKSYRADSSWNGRRLA